jgi:hypothetical protein
MNIRSILPAAGRAALLLLAALAVSACNPIVNDSTSNTMLIIESLTGLDLDGLASGFCKSDVLYVDPSTGATSIVADIGTAILSSQPLDPNPILGNSTYLDIQLTKVSIVYVRADGRNTPGQDVPYPFEAGVAGTVRVGTLFTLSFTLVREAAKLESPLIQLRDVAETLEVTAEITFWGKDLSGRAVKAVGYLPITFANYAN